MTDLMLSCCPSRSMPVMRISAVPQWISILLLPMGPASAGAATRHRLVIPIQAHLKLDLVSVPIDNETSFVITTDGITTQIGEQNTHGFGYRRFQETLASASDNSPKMLNRAIMRAFREWQGSQERRDDITLLSFKPVLG